MKCSYISVLVIAALTLAVWMFFWIRTPSVPLGPTETTVVALVNTLIVLLVKPLWRRIGKHDDKTTKP